MKRRHPIDDMFRQGLASRSEEPPMHLWENIDRQRTPAHRLRMYLWRHRHALLLTAGLLIFSLSWWAWPAPPPELGHFPIPLAAQTDPPAPEPSLSPVPLPAPTEQEPPQISPVVQRPVVAPQPVPERTIAALLPSDPEQPTTGVGHPTDLSMTISAHSAETAVKAPTSRFLPVDALPTLPAAVELPAPDPAQLFPNDPKCARFNRIRWRLAVDLMASPDLAMRQLAPRDSEYESYAQSRESTESAEYSFSTALRLSLLSNIGLAFRSGLNYSQINERFEYINRTEERIVITNIYGPDGQITGTDTIVEMGIRHKMTHNHYRMIDIPLIVGYERQVKKFRLSVNGGAYLNLLFRQQGDFLSPGDLQPVSFSSDNPQAFPAFRDRLSLSWYGSLGVAYQLTPGTQLLVEPHVRLHPRSFTLEQYMLKQQYLTAGLFLGIRKNI